MMNYNPQELWNSFIISFIKNLNLHNKENPLSKTLLNKEKMTSFYKQELFQEIADDLKLELSEKEYLRVDMHLYEIGTNGYSVPIIFIESENDPEGDLTNEIQKLLSVNAPLKILMTRNSFEDDFNNDNDTHWRYNLEDFAEFNRLVGYFAVISAVWENDNLIYQYVVYNEYGKPIGKLEKINLI